VRPAAENVHELCDDDTAVRVACWAWAVSLSMTAETLRGPNASSTTPLAASEVTKSPFRGAATVI
jgi:hypothetical protein